MSDKQPIGIVRVVDACARRESPNAVYAMVLCQDEAGNAWHFSVSCFNFDLKPGAPLYTTSALSVTSREEAQ